MTAGSSGFEWDSRKVFSTCHIHWAQFSSSGKLYKGELWLHCSSTFHYMLWATTLNVENNVKGIQITAQPMKVCSFSLSYNIIKCLPHFPLISLSKFPSDLPQLLRAEFLMLKLFWFMDYFFTSSHLLDSICRFFFCQKHRQWNHWSESSLDTRKCKRHPSNDQLASSH